MNRKKIVACAIAVCCAAGILLLALARMQNTPIERLDTTSASTASSNEAVTIEPPTQVPAEDLPVKVAPPDVNSKPAEEKAESPASTPKPVQPAVQTPAPQPKPEQTPALEPPAQPVPEQQPPVPRPPANPEPLHYHGNGSDGGTCPVCGMGYSPSINMDGLTPEDDLEDLS
ncbi:MAG: hypothetical protein RR635_01360 [Oscillospiraceae bacterium]